MEKAMASPPGSILRPGQVTGKVQISREAEWESCAKMTGTEMAPVLYPEMWRPAHGRAENRITRLSKDKPALLSQSRAVMNHRGVTQLLLISPGLIRAQKAPIVQEIHVRGWDPLTLMSENAKKVSWRKHYHPKGEAAKGCICND